MVVPVHSAHFHADLKNKQGRPTMPAMGDLGTFVRARRQELGLNLDQCARKAGISLQALSLIELGKTQNLKATTAYRLAQALEVDVSTFFGRLEAVPA